jgi:hypothetical protein
MFTEDSTRFISIWFFIGLILLIYGILITGTGIYELFVPPPRPIVLANLHAAVWWGALLTIIGAGYSYRFFPGRKRG